MFPSALRTLLPHETMVQCGVRFEPLSDRQKRKKYGQDSLPYTLPRDQTFQQVDERHGVEGLSRQESCSQIETIRYLILRDLPASANMTLETGGRQRRRTPCQRDGQGIVSCRFGALHLPMMTLPNPAPKMRVLVVDAMAMSCHLLADALQRSERCS